MARNKITKVNKLKQKEQKISLLKELIRKIAGKASEPIVNILFSKKNVNEFKIAEKLGITINQARNILYRLSDHSIMESTRKKDKRKGWYTYFWTINMFKAFILLAKIKQKEVDVMEHIIKSRKMKTFYVCSQDNIEMSEETAMHHNFLCPECGKLLQPVSEEKKIKELNSKIVEAKKEILIINEEIEKIREKIAKAMPKVKPKKRKKRKLKKPKKPKLKKLKPKRKEGRKKVKKKKKIKKKVKKLKPKRTVKKVKIKKKKGRKKLKRRLFKKIFKKVKKIKKRKKKR